MIGLSATNLIDCNASLKVIDTAQHEIDGRLVVLSTVTNAIDKVVVMIDADESPSELGTPCKLAHQPSLSDWRLEIDIPRNVVGVGLVDNVGVDLFERLLGGVGLGHAGLVGSEEQAVHVGDLDLVVVEEEQLADATTTQHLGRHATDATETDDQDTKVSNALCVFGVSRGRSSMSRVSLAQAAAASSAMAAISTYRIVLDDAHAFEGHQAAIGRWQQSQQGVSTALIGSRVARIRYVGVPVRVRVDDLAAHDLDLASTLVGCSLLLLQLLAQLLDLTLEASDLGTQRVLSHNRGGEW